MLLQRLSRSSGAAAAAAAAAAACRSASSPAASILPRATIASSLRQRRERRELHQVQQLSYEKEFVEHGVPGLLSRDGFDISWTKYQALMMEKLNEITAGFDAEHATTKQLVLQYARNPATAALFNHASMAHNNEFFFNALSPAPTALERYSGLQKSLISAFGSIETLRQTMLHTADSMFGPGFVWLVYTKDGNWRILNTYLAGTPYAEAGYRQQDRDMNTVANTAGAFGVSSAAGKKQAALPPGAVSVVPVLCVNTWEHVYLADFGVDGKQEYLQRWWDAINWYSVNNLTPDSMKDQTLGKFVS
ncbi:hypothetical protein AAFC00_007032 [Neodothiora populina]|uniref:Manganese/iron superoxide dismutase C-terminal domain-containing protein n=1 Tax=Neodothiora populina TaxID=2781224 RepID=A0ABR3PBZ4_9PEZI